MPEHVHLLIRPRAERYSISRILTAIKWPVAHHALHYLRQHAPDWIERLADQQSNGGVAVRFWQRGGGFDRNVRGHKTALAMLDYIHANPVRRGLVATPAEWRWSSAAWYEGRRNVPLAIDETLL